MFLGAVCRRGNLWYRALSVPLLCGSFLPCFFVFGWLSVGGDCLIMDVLPLYGFFFCAGWLCVFIYTGMAGCVKGAGFNIVVG